MKIGTVQRISICFCQQVLLAKLHPDKCSEYKELVQGSSGASIELQGKDCVVGFVHLTIQWNPCQDVTWRETRTVDIGHSVGVSPVAKIRCFVFGWWCFQHPEMFLWNPTMKSLTSDNTSQARGWRHYQECDFDFEWFPSQETFESDWHRQLFVCMFTGTKISCTSIWPSQALVTRMLK